MVHIQVTWRCSPSPSPEGPDMQNFPADNLPSLSATTPTNDLTEKPINGFHDTTKPFTTTDTLIKPTKRSSTNKTNEAAVRVAKQEILSKLREDWEWPPPETQSENTQPSLPSPESWRERDSDSSYTPPSPALDPYRFDTPDDLAQPVLSKKRKRREMLEEEMKWNEGLRTYIQRRDAWAGARIEPLPLPMTAQESLNNTPTNHPKNTTPASHTLPSHTPSTVPPTTLVPIVPPLLPPTNPIRSTITPSTYPQIYSKIILQGLSPTVPINLRDVVAALVQGWKKDGEWPPKTDAEKNGNGNGGKGEGHGGADVGGGGRMAVRRSVGRMKKVLGLGQGIDGPGRGEGRGQE